MPSRRTDDQLSAQSADRRILSIHTFCYAPRPHLHADTCIDLIFFGGLSDIPIGPDDVTIRIV